MKDLHNNLAPVTVLHSVVVAATFSAEIDLADCNSAELLLDVGVDAGTGLEADTHQLAFTVTHADDDGTGSSGTYEAVATGDILGTVPTIDTTDKDNTLYNFGYVGGKRFIKITGTETGVISMPLSIVVIKGHLRDSPAL